MACMQLNILPCQDMAEELAQPSWLCIQCVTQSADMSAHARMLAGYDLNKQCGMTPVTHTSVQARQPIKLQLWHDS
jgi:hypothetical protein